MEAILAQGQVWKECIEPYKGGIWHVLPVFEFFKLSGFDDPAKIPRAYIKVLFQCIKDTPKLHKLLVDICNDVDGFLEAHRQQNQQRYFDKKHFTVDHAISWSFGSEMVNGDGVFRGIRLVDFHDCIKTFRQCYVKKDFALFTEGMYWPHVITLLTMGLRYHYPEEHMLQANEFMCLSTGPGHRKDNARLFKMFANLDKSKGGILSAFIFNESNNEIGIALFEIIADTDGEDFDVPCIYTTGDKTDNQAWCRLVQDLFPDKAEIDETIMTRPQIGECFLANELNEPPEQDEETGNESDELSERDKETRDLNWALRVMDMLGLIIVDTEMPILSADEKEQLDMSLIAKVMQCLMARGLDLIANQIAPPA